MRPMRRALCLCALSGALLAGCGSATKTVTDASAPTTSAVTTGTQSTVATATATAPKTTATATAPAATSTTRTAPEPAFAEEGQTSQPAGVGSAVAVLRAHGYSPADTSEYHPAQTLRVLVGTRTGSADGYGQQAFFFLGAHYLGTDAKEASAKLRVIAQSDTEVAIAYPLYRSGDPLCCPGGGQRVVHFALNDGKLTALDPIPPASSKTGLARN